MKYRNDRDQMMTNIKQILKAHQVKKAALFGSYARGEEKSDSDVDILVDLPRGKTLLDLVRLERAVGDAIGKKVDVVTYRSINPLVKKYILKDTLQIL